MDQVLITANVAPNAADDSYTLVKNTTLTKPAPAILANDTPMLNTDSSLPSPIRISTG